MTLPAGSLDGRHERVWHPRAPCVAHFDLLGLHVVHVLEVTLAAARTHLAVHSGMVRSCAHFAKWRMGRTGKLTHFRALFDWRREDGTGNACVPNAWKSQETRRVVYLGNVYEHEVTVERTLS